ncbi:ubiquitin receptor RAD23b-like [Magnolia sinica]|uniref:ubiquitin receptor RAD23b-like n=1 Tax=Magnolia sinica TaxID=86752 RepID=UPI002658519E|nr:ubiquitin receptor RAD23b-like [Magnolia sinica]
MIDMGDGSWDQETVMCTLHAAYNNLERAVEYLYSGIPAAAEVVVPVARVPSNQASAQGDNATKTEVDLAGVAPLSGLPNLAPLNLFPQFKF